MIKIHLQYKHWSVWNPVPSMDEKMIHRMYTQGIVCQFLFLLHVYSMECKRQIMLPIETSCPSNYERTTVV